MPDQRAGDPIEDGLLHNLQRMVEYQTSEVGMVMKVTRILSYGYGTVDTANFLGIAVFPVKYEAMVCCPSRGMHVVCRIDNIMEGTLVATNNRLVINSFLIDIDPSVFSYTEGDMLIHVASGERIKIGDIVVIVLTHVTRSKNMPNITAVGILSGMASEEMKQAYYQENRAFAPAVDEDYI